MVFIILKKIEKERKKKERKKFTLVRALRGDVSTQITFSTQGTQGAQPPPTPHPLTPALSSARAPWQRQIGANAGAEGPPGSLEQEV